MIALAEKYVTYANEVNSKRELVVTGGVSAMLRILEPLAVANINRAREAHRKVIDSNINRYGKIKNFSKNI